MDCLGDIPGFQDLTFEVQSLIVRNMRVFRYPVNAIICYKHQSATLSWILLSGSVVDMVDGFVHLNAPSFFHSQTSIWDTSLMCSSNVALLAFPRKILDANSVDLLTHVNQFQKQSRICQPLLNHDIPLTCRIISDIKPTSTLEVGCGLGFFSRFLSELTSELTLSDPNPEALARACDLVSWCNPNISLSSRACSAEDFTVSSVKFNLIVTRMALHHMQDLDLFFVNMLNLLQPNGFLILTDLLGSDEPCFHDFLNRRETLLDSTHQSILSCRTLKNLIRTHGLSVCEFNQSQVLSSLRAHSSNHHLSTAKYAYLHDWLLSSPAEYKKNIDLRHSECGDLFWVDDRFTVALQS